MFQSFFPNLTFSYQDDSVVVGRWVGSYVGNSIENSVDTNGNGLMRLSRVLVWKLLP